MSTKPVILSEQSLHRFQAGDLILRGYGNNEIIDILEVSLASVKRWRKSVESTGLQALSRKSRTDYPKKLNDSKRHELEKIIRDGARASGYLVDRWTSRMVADLIRKKWGIDYSCSHVRRILHSLNLSCQKPDVEAAEHSTEAVKYWRHYVWPSIKKKRTTTVTS